MSIHVGDTVRISRKFIATLPPEERAQLLPMRGHVYEVDPLWLSVHWQPPAQLRRAVVRSWVEHVPVGSNPHTDLPHHQRHPQHRARRILADWLREQGYPGCAARLLSTEERAARVLLALARRGGEALALATAAGYTPPPKFHDGSILPKTAGGDWMRIADAAGNTVSLRCHDLQVTLTNATGADSAPVVILNPQQYADLQRGAFEATVSRLRVEAERLWPGEVPTTPRVTMRSGNALGKSTQLFLEVLAQLPPAPRRVRRGSSRQAPPPQRGEWWNR